MINKIISPVYLTLRNLTRQGPAGYQTPPRKNLIAMV